MLEEKNKKIIISVFLGLSLISAAILSGYFLVGKGNQIAREKEISRLNENFNLGKSSIVQSINEGNSYQGAIEKANLLLENKEFADLGQEANLKILLAESYVNDLREDDFKKGLNILKESAANDAYPAKWRAIAFDRLVSFVSSKGASFAKENVFNDAYFSPMMEEGDLGIALRKLDERSLALYNTVVPNYRIANWYALQLIENGKLSEEEKKKYLQITKAMLENGEALFNKEDPHANWDDVRLILVYQYYGEVATKLYLLKEFDDSQKIIDSFNNAVKIYEKRYNFKDWPVAKDKIIALPLKAQLPSLIFSYATSSAVIQNQENQEKIGAILGVLYDKEWNEKNIFNIFDFLSSEKNISHANQYHRLKIVSLAKADNRFANLLKELGWTENDLNSLPVLPFESIK